MAEKTLEKDRGGDKRNLKTVGPVMVKNEQGRYFLNLGL